MRTADLDIILVPGGPVGDGHWIARWERNLKTARLLTPPDPGPPDPGAWERRLISAAQGGDTQAAPRRQRLIVGHGLGATLIALAAPRLAEMPVAGAVLVAPHDPQVAVPSPDDGAVWPALPTEPFGFAAMVIATRNNPLMPFTQARKLAEGWAATFVDAGEAGTIDDRSGHGPWPEGLMRLGRFLKHL